MGSICCGALVGTLVAAFGVYTLFKFFGFLF